MEVLNDPVLIIGMHRSGTTLVSRFLDELGVYTGTAKEVNNESYYFIRLNDWILNQAKASWDNPISFGYLDEATDKRLIKDVASYLNSASLRKYLGIGNYLRYRNLSNIPFAWGWKDPRTTVTLKIWLSIFPNAKVIHLYRNPIDIALSLHRRNNQIEFRDNFKKKIKRRFIIGRQGYKQSIRLNNLNQGVYLWEEYLKALELTIERVPINILHIKYEELLTTPKINLLQIANFLDITVNDQVLDQFSHQIVADKKYAFLSTAEGVEMYDRFKSREMFNNYGYSDIK